MPRINGASMEKPFDRNLNSRREQRFSICDTDLRVLVYQQGEQAEPLETEALDISSHGLRVLSSEPLAFEEEMRLEFRSEHCDLSFTVEAEVRWIRNQDSQWVVGFCMADALPAEAVHALSIAGGIDRRRSKRFPSDFQAELVLPGRQKASTVTAIDHSNDGVRIVTALRDIAQGQKMKLVMIDDEGHYYEVMATSKWVQSQEWGSVIGCEINSGSIVQFRNCIDRMQHQGRVWRIPRMWLGLGYAAIVMWLIAWYVKL